MSFNLNLKIREKAKLIAEKIRYLELANDPDFNQEFSKALYLPNKDIKKFPSVKETLSDLIHEN